MNRSFLTANFSNVLRHTFCLKGRAARRELWGFVLLPWLVFLCVCLGLAALSFLMRMCGVSAGGAIIQLVLGMNLLFTMWLAVLFVPFFTLCIRRLHDVGRGCGWLVAWGVLNVPVLLMSFSAMACGEPFMALAAFAVLPALLSHLILPAAAVSTGTLALTLCYLITDFLLSFFLLIHFVSSGDKAANEYGPPPAPIP